MDITTLSKSELIELLYAVTEKAKKKGVQSPDDVGYAQYPVRDGETKYYVGGGKTAARSDWPQKKPSASQKTPRVMPGSRVDINKQNRDAAAGRKKNEAQMKRRKELFESTEKAKKKGGGDGGPKATGNEPRPSKTFTREAMNRPEGPGNKYSAPQGPDKKGRSMKKSWQWEAPIGKMRGKELFEATEKAKKKSAQPPTPSSNPDAFGKPNDLKRNILQGIQSERKRDPYKMGPNEERNYNLKYTPVRKPSASQKTPRVMPGSRVDINKQNRDAAANQKKATLNKRSDFHKMKVNEAKTKRRKELQTEQAIDQYLSYESEMDDNRQLMFEVITEKAKKRNISNPYRDVKPGDPMDKNYTQRDRDTLGRAATFLVNKADDNYKKAGGKGRTVGERPRGEKFADTMIGNNQPKGNPRRDRQDAARLHQSGSKMQRDIKTMNYNAQPHRRNPSAETKDILKYGGRNKELQFDGSLVVGAESFFLQMVAATKPK